MMMLWEVDGITIKNIAQQLHLDSPTITPLLKRLESAGFVKRLRSISDESVVNVFLTNAGRGIQACVADMQKDVACQTGMAESQFIELRSTLHELVDSINHKQPDMQDAA